MKGNVDGEEAKARLKARKRMMNCFSDTRNKRQLEQINFTHFTFANRTCKTPERRHSHKVNFISSVRSSNSHPDLLLTQHPPTFSDHTGP